MGLVLTRRVGERVRVGDDVIVEVVGFDEGRVRLRFIAPPSVKVFREELIGRPDRTKVGKRLSEAVAALRAEG